MTNFILWVLSACMLFFLGEHLGKTEMKNKIAENLITDFKCVEKHK